MAVTSKGSWRTISCTNRLIITPRQHRLVCAATKFLAAGNRSPIGRCRDGLGSSAIGGRKRRMDKRGPGALRTFSLKDISSLGEPASSRIGVLVASNSECGLQAAISAARSMCDCKVIGLLAEDQGHGITVNKDLRLEAMGIDTWRLYGTLEDAVTCGLEPQTGLLSCLKLMPAMCLVGISREPSLGEDHDHSRSASAAKRASVLGVPSVAVCLPSMTTSLSLDSSQEALRNLLPHVLRILSNETADSKTNQAVNFPRAHFPFPSRGRWSALGGPQLPGTDADFGASLASGSNSGYSDFAAADCWSYGDDIPQQTRGVVPNSSAEEMQDILREAFREGDVFLVVHVPPKWSFANATKPFASTRAGVLWHQENVSAIIEKDATVSGQNGESVCRGTGTSHDLWGRSLPQHTIGQPQPSSDGAGFVPQLNTAKVIRELSSVGDNVNTYDIPEAFSIGMGKVLMDGSSRGDVDAVFSGITSVTTAQTWPQSHAFSLLDSVMVESLREDPQSGLPVWLTVPQPPASNDNW